MKGTTLTEHSPPKVTIFSGAFSCSNSRAAFVCFRITLRALIPRSVSLSFISSEMGNFHGFLGTWGSEDIE